ncbi:PEP-CTERM sorting domain-containing protein [Betaproteobacteria bacterium SCN1]|jgi:hypothetical protein|nr:PEP-CTERM sorting domain-containing protein [Betaproteobacteria bacterium SCN1]MBN8759256.1 PEP-CTERM sorting domain-containing protein [Thiobacillus sp.]ODU90210.1 MAG: hypothetical protein ABT21_06055 [Thiobacillus sp. SCN 65-179]OJW38353.1 MAG: hypothetical protein BGO61_12565 [Thiobacillus sp. 65-69]
MLKTHLAFAALMAVSMPVLADEDHLHAGDIEVEVDAGQLVAHGAAQTQSGTGYAIFESDFGDFAGGPYRTDDPGYDSAAGTFAAGTIINYQALGSLWYWNGLNWGNSVVNGETVQLDGNFGETTVWTVGGVTGDGAGLVGQAGSDGKIHEHLDMSIEAPAGFLPTAGAYYVALQLVSEGYANSDPFLVVFNNGLGTEAYELAVGALAAPVPEPETYAMLLAGLGLIAFKLRRRHGA